MVGSMAAGGWVGIALEQELRACILRCKHETKKERQIDGNGIGFETSEPVLTDTPPPTDPSKTVPPPSIQIYGWGGGILTHATTQLRLYFVSN